MEQFSNVSWENLTHEDLVSIVKSTKKVILVFPAEKLNDGRLSMCVVNPSGDPLLIAEAALALLKLACEHPSLAIQPPKPLDIFFSSNN